MQSAGGSRNRGRAAAEAHADLLVVGGGTGGCAAALAATSLGLQVIMTEATDWIGGQLTSQMVPPDESPWIEGQGCTARYRRYRDAVRQYYRDHYPLTPAARADPFLNPGQGTVSRLCHEPRVGVAVLEGLLSFARTAGLLDLRLWRVPVAASTNGDRVESVTVVERHSGRRETISADVVVDATELGDLLPLAGVEYVTGAESRGDTGEEHAVDGPAQPHNVQPLTWCLAVGHDPRPGADHTIDRPDDYDAWRSYTPPTTPPWPGRLLSPVEVAPATLKPRNAPFFEDEDDVDPSKQFTGWWSYRRVIYAGHLASSRRIDEATILNWPHNDYMVASVIDRAGDEVRRHYDAARQLSLSLLYWLQTERPRPDGGCGYPGLYPRPRRLRRDRRACQGAIHPRVPPHQGTADGHGSARRHRDARGLGSGPAARGSRAARGAATGGDLRGLRRDRLLPHRPAPRAPAATTTSTSPVCRSRSRSGRCFRAGLRTCCRRARTSAPPTSPTAAIGCTPWSGTSARRWGCLPGSACGGPPSPDRCPSARISCRTISGCCGIKGLRSSGYR